MARPQLKRGYLRIAVELFDQITLAPFSRRQYKVLNAIIRMTYGWSQREAGMSSEAIASRTGLDRGNVSKTLHELETMQVIERRQVPFKELLEDGSKVPYVFVRDDKAPLSGKRDLTRLFKKSHTYIHVIGIQKDYEKWRFDCVTVTQSKSRSDCVTVTTTAGVTVTTTAVVTPTQSKRQKTTPNKDLGVSDRSLERKDHIHSKECTVTPPPLVPKEVSKKSKTTPSWSAEETRQVTNLFKLINRNTGHSWRVLNANNNPTRGAQRCKAWIKRVGFDTLTDATATAIRHLNQSHEQHPRGNWLDGLSPQQLYTENSMERWIGLTGDPSDEG